MMHEFKTDRNAVGVPITFEESPDRIDEVSEDEYFFTWETPGEYAEGVFTEGVNAEVLIMHMKKTGTVWMHSAAKAKWTDRAGGGVSWVPWSKRHLVLA